MIFLDCILRCVICAFVAFNIELKCRFNKRFQTRERYTSVISIFYQQICQKYWLPYHIIMFFPKELAYWWNGRALHKQQCFNWSAKTVCCFLSCDFCGSCDITQQALQPAVMNAIAMQFAPCTMQVYDLRTQYWNVKVLPLSLLSVNCYISESFASHLWAQ